MNPAIGFMVFLVAGAVLGLGAFILALKALRFLRRAGKATATVIQSKRGGIVSAIDRERMKGSKIVSLDPVTTGYPGAQELVWNITVEFEDAKGAKRQGTAEVGARSGLSNSKVQARGLSRRFGRRFYEVGDPVPILYDPERPEVIRLDSFREQWFGPLVLGALGAAFFVIGVLGLSGVLPMK